MVKAPKWPKSMAQCADLLHAKREARLEADRYAATLKEEEQSLINHIIDNLPKDSRGAVGREYQIKTYTEDLPVVNDWSKFHAYVAKHKAWDLLERRVARVAARDRLADAGKRGIPGLGVFTTVKVSLTKIGK